VDAVVSLGLLGALMAGYGCWPTARVLTLPLFVLLALVASLGAGVWLAALSVRYRDFRLVVPFLLQLGLYLSPVGFSSSVIPERWRLLYSLNPLVGVIDGFRWSLLRGEAPLYWPAVALSAGLSLSVLVSGLGYFRRTERTFADVI
jgi:lipopolysaccharide transport system permease protein